MILLINNKPAALKQDVSIEYNSVNPLFGDREDYTLNIELPLNNKANLAIFGRLDRLDANIDDIFFDAVIIDGNFRKSGAVAITSITEAIIKVQFLADRSFQNFYPDFDKKYIDELALPFMPKWIPDNIAEQTNGYTENRNQNGRSGSGHGYAGNRNGHEGDDDEDPVTSEYKSPDDVWGDSEGIIGMWQRRTNTTRKL